MQGKLLAMQGTVLQAMLWYGVVSVILWYAIQYHETVLFGMVWLGMVWCIWYGMVWYSVAWYGVS